MQGIRIARFAALAAAVALVVPGLAAAGNEVTKWNEIALNAIVGGPPARPAPPAGFLGPPVAAGVFVGAAGLGCVRGDGAGGRVRRGQRSGPARTPVSDQPELSESVGGR